MQIDGETVGAIGEGLLVLVAIEREDRWTNARKLADKLLDYRVFSDKTGRMNHSVRDVGGGLLVVPQFTLSATTHKGNRPGFDAAMPPEAAEKLFDRFHAYLKEHHCTVASGRFGAYMRVHLVNDGPVTFSLRC